MFGRKKNVAEAQVDSGSSDYNNGPNVDPLAEVPKSRWERIWPAMACGSGLFSDGYINNVIGSVSTCLETLYGDAYTKSSAQKNITAITFAGTVLGQLVFGYLSDKWSRSNSLLLSTIILIIFAALGAGSYGGGTLSGMFAALTAYRFLVGIGIGGEYPAGSVACSEATGELKSGTRNRWFILFTNVMIDWGFVVGAFVPYLLIVICTDKHVRAAWRIMLGLGVVPPLLLLYLRLKLKEPEEFKRESMKHVRIPYGLVLRYYGFRLAIVSAIWFIYDFSTYSFGLYSSTILANIYGANPSLALTFGWNTVINLFYIPGAMLGSIFSDKVGPKYALAIGVTLQAIVGFGMAGGYDHLARPGNVGGFAVVYGLFLSLGEFGPGDNIGLVASKTCATGVRGQYYAIAAAIGKIGAFVGTYVFKYIEKAGGSGTNSVKYPFYVSSSLCILSACLVMLLPHIGQDTITTEDIKFREYLESKGWDTNQLGLMKGESIENRVEREAVNEGKNEKL
ncbi:Major glycerophosphoinositol permease GIT3 [Lachnellula suecica]|uniref:Major glycerophosphoinositol permease GIT3 n=1 Tax=Lachnellula suecica TaxID=602035 RepID=A0A8T9CG41_9HELO|nr:Major glycerophosphoinositol permease GIT3 [Lachnellula suecica]